MHSFHPSRGRILFEVFCAFALAASLAGAWVQTGASALLAASFAAALFGLSHAFGMGHGRAVAVESKPIDFITDDQGDVLVEMNGAEQPEAIVEADPADPLVPEKEARKAKAPRKPRTRRKPAEEAVATEPPPAKEAEVAVPWPLDDHPRIEPLFEPEPFVRQPRAVVFGRKAG